MLAVLVAMTAVGCSHRVARESGGDVDLGARGMRGEDWGGKIHGIGGWSNLQGSIYARETADGAVVTVTVDRGVAGAAYGWELLEGKCGSPGRRVANPADFPPLYVEDSGHGAAIATLKAKLVPRTPYFVNLYTSSENLYASPEQRTNIIACGTLAD
jgi:hypothetical protein